MFFTTVFETFVEVQCVAGPECGRGLQPLHAYHRYHREELQYYRQGVTKRCRLSWLTNSAILYEPKCVGRGGVAWPQPMSLYAGAQINFGDLTPYLTYDYRIPCPPANTAIEWQPSYSLNLSLSFSSLCRRYRLVYARWRDDGGIANCHVGATKNAVSFFSVLFL